MTKPIDSLLKANDDEITEEALKYYCIYCSILAESSLQNKETREKWKRMGKKVEAIMQIRGISF